MERKTRVLWILAIAVVIIAMMAAIGSAGAEGGRTLMISVPIPEPKRGIDYSGPQTVETCEEQSWTIIKSDFIQPDRYYEHIIAIADGSYASGAADMQYRSPRMIGSSFDQTISYIFYEPGSYWLLTYEYETEDAEKRSASIYQRITVTEGSGANALTEAVAAAAQVCRKENDFQTVAAINEYICDLVTYDKSYTFYSAQAALLGEHKGVCNSYSRSFKLIADACGLECRRVTGKAKNEGHAWNVVKMDGNWYQMDLTWNDTGIDRHLYFGLTDELMNYEHSSMYYVDDSGIICDTLDDNWFMQTGEWKTRLARDSLPNIQNAVIAGETQIEVSFGKLYANATSSNGYNYIMNDGEPYGKYYLYGNLLAYAYSQQTWIRRTYSVTYKLQGNFVYDFDTNSLSAILVVVSTDPEEEFFVLPADTVIIGEDAFAGINATVVRIPDKCTTIGAGAFAESGLEAVYIPDTVIVIGENAFPDGTIIYTLPGSMAATWGTDHHYTVITD